MCYDCAFKWLDLNFMILQFAVLYKIYLESLLVAPVYYIYNKSARHLYSLVFNIYEYKEYNIITFIVCASIRDNPGPWFIVYISISQLFCNGYPLIYCLSVTQSTNSH